MLLNPKDPAHPLPMPDKTKDGKGWTVKTALEYSPRLAAHLDLVDRHIAALRNAMAAARALHRQLVLPKYAEITACIVSRRGLTY